MQEMYRHLKDAILINSERMSLYADLTQGKSVPFSKTLIRFEKLGLITSRWVDRQGDRFQKQGIPIVKEEMIDMKFTPEFSPQFPEEIDYSKPLLDINIKALKKEISKAFKKKDYLQVVSSSNRWIEELEHCPHHHCMLKHLLESIRRIAHLAPLHQKRSEELQTKSTLSLSNNLIRLHMILIKAANTFDRKVAPIQKIGVPFIFQDVPKIGLENSYEVK